MAKESFQIWDYLVVAAMLAVSAVIGIHFRFSGGKQKTTSEFLMAGRNMAIFPVTLSLMATIQTAIATLGFPAEIYLYGTQLFLYPIGFIFAVIICTFIHTPVYFKIQVTSAYEYLERRFGKVTRIVISGLFIFQMQVMFFVGVVGPNAAFLSCQVLFMSVVLYSPSIALSAVSGLSHFVSILCVGSVCAFYCTMGGMKAVLWTDVFQSVIMCLALLAVIIKGTLDVGGFGEIINKAESGNRLEFFNFSPDPSVRFTVWSAVLGGFMYGLTTSGANQTQVQRLLTLNTLRRSQIALLLSIPLNLVMYYCTFMSGVVLYSNFAGCDPLLRTKESGISSADQLIPYFMITSFSSIPGMAGFCVSGVFCAALTSISSAVNSLAAVTMEDFVKPFCKCKSWFTDAKSALLAKLLALFYSALCIGMTYMVGSIKAIIPAGFVVFTAVGGPTLSIITLGMLTTTSNQRGILFGLLLGIALNAWIGFGSLISGFHPTKLPQTTDECPVNITLYEIANITSLGHFNYSVEHLSPTDATSILLKNEEIFPLYKMSFLLHPIPGTILTLIIGYFVSFLTGGNKEVDPDLLAPIVQRLFKLEKNKQENNEKDMRSCNSTHELSHNFHLEIQQGKNINGIKPKEKASVEYEKNRDIEDNSRL